MFLTLMSFICQVRVLPLDGLQNLPLKIKSKMDTNLEKEDIISTGLPSCLSQPVYYVDPAMPTLSLDLNECGK